MTSTSISGYYRSGFLLILAAFLIWIAYLAGTAAIKKQARLIDIYNTDSKTAERHVWVSKHKPSKFANGDVPVHILRKQDGIWKLCGTGLKLGAYPDFVLSAYHVFEDHGFEYAVRAIGPGEFTGDNALSLVVGAEYTPGSADSLLCRIDPKATASPVINLRKVDNFDNYDVGTQYNFLTWFPKLRFTTYPEMEIQGLFKVDVRPGVTYEYFNWAPVHGESGTAALVEGEEPGTYMVIIWSQMLPKRLIDDLRPENKKLFNWHEGKLYGVGHLVRIAPPKKI